MLIPKPNEVFEDSVELVGETTSGLGDVAMKVLETGNAMLDMAGDAVKNGGSDAGKAMQDVAAGAEKIASAYGKILFEGAKSVREISTPVFQATGAGLRVVVREVAECLTEIQDSVNSKGILVPVKGTIDIEVTVKSLPGAPGVEARMHLDLERVATTPASAKSLTKPK